MSNKTKKIIISCSLMSLLTMTACAKNTLDKEKKAAEEGKPRTPVIGTVVSDFGDRFMKYTRSAMNVHMSETNLEMEIINSRMDSSIQREQIETYYARKIDALVVDMVDPARDYEIAESANEHNVPLIFLHREPRPFVMQIFQNTWFVGTTKESKRKWQTEILKKYMEDNPAKEEEETLGEPHILYVGSNLGMADTVEFNQNFLDQLTSVYLERVEGIICESDGMALQVIERIQENGYNQEESEQYVPVIGFGASKEGMKAIKDGSLLGTVAEDSKNQGTAAAKIAVLEAQYKKFDKEEIGYDIEDERYVRIDYVKVTKDNYNDYMR